MVNWQLSKQDSHWPVSHCHIGGSCVNSSRWRDLFGSCPPTSCFTSSQSYSISYFLAKLRAQENIHWTSMLWSIDSCQNRVSDQYDLSVSRAQVLTLRGQVYFQSCPLTSYWFSNDRRLKFDFFKIHMKYVLFLCRTIKWFKTDK